MVLVKHNKPSIAIMHQVSQLRSSPKGLLATRTEADI
jgi:hypothetical protein